MSTKKILRWALDTETGTVSEKMLLLTLAIHADGEGLVSPGPSWSTLRRQTRLSRSSIHAALRGLEDRGVIIRANRCRTNGSHSSCEYLLAVHSGETPGPVQPSDRSPSSHRTGPRPAIGPVQSLDGSTGPVIGPVPTSGNGGPVQSLDPTRPVIGPLEVKEKELQELAAARYARDAHTRARETTAAPRPSTSSRRNSSAVQDKLEQLSATAVGKDAYTLVLSWRTTHTPPLLDKRYQEFQVIVQKLLDHGAQPADIRKALAVWDTRPKAFPGLLPDLWEDVIKERRAWQGKPVVDENGFLQRPLQEVADEDLTRAVLERIVAEPNDLRYEYPSEEIENDGKLRAAWYADWGNRRLVLWRAVAREKLVKQRQRAT